MLSRKLQRTNKDQYTVTIPKALVDLLSWKEQSEITFNHKRNALALSKQRKKDAISRQLQKTNKDQYTITIPKTFIELLNWKEQQQISFSLDNNNLILRGEHHA